MGDIILTNTLEIVAPAKKIVNYSWQITPEGIIAHLNYYNTAGNTVVKQETFYIQGADFESLKNAVIVSGVVGQKYLDVIEKAIRNKVLAMKGWIGTVS